MNRCKDLFKPKKYFGVIGTLIKAVDFFYELLNCIAFFVLLWIIFGTTIPWVTLKAGIMEWWNPKVLPYMGYIGMCCCEGYGFQAVYSSVGCID